LHLSLSDAFCWGSQSVIVSMSPRWVNAQTGPQVCYWECFSGHVFQWVQLPIEEKAWKIWPENLWYVHKVQTNISANTHSTLWDVVKDWNSKYCIFGRVVYRFCLTFLFLSGILATSTTMTAATDHVLVVFRRTVFRSGLEWNDRLLTSVEIQQKSAREGADWILRRFELVELDVTTCTLYPQNGYLQGEPGKYVYPIQPILIKQQWSAGTYITKGQEV
jgi:hypothetical protein